MPLKPEINDYISNHDIAVLSQSFIIFQAKTECGCQGVAQCERQIKFV